MLNSMLKGVPYMKNENKRRAGVALALGVLAEAEATVIYFHPNLDVSGDALFGTTIKIDPLNQTAGLSSTDGSLLINYWCWGNYLDGREQSDTSGNAGEFLSTSVLLNDTVSSEGTYTNLIRTSHTSSELGEYYWGFRISNSETPTVYNYGYVHFSAQHAENKCHFTLYDVAYESEAGKSINVGAVPEPAATGTIIMMSVFLVSVFRKLGSRIHGKR